MILRADYVIENELYYEALEYAENAKKYTSNRHDFHEGGFSEYVGAVLHPEPLSFYICIARI